MDTVIMCLSSSVLLLVYLAAAEEAVIDTGVASVLAHAVAVDSIFE